MSRETPDTGTPVHSNPNQSLDYDSWVSSIQDGFFQATPMTSHILQQSTFQSGGGMNTQQQQQSFPQQYQQHSMTGVNVLNGAQLGHDLSMDMVFNSPERFYRDIINESPVMSRTPLIGRTPLRNLSANFSTPNFLKNIETNGPMMHNSATRNFTPLKNQLFSSNDLFQTPHDSKKENSTNLNSSPTTIKMGSSAVKDDDAPNVSKILPPSPTPGYKSNGSMSSKAVAPMPNAPKMGCFKKATEEEPKPRARAGHRHPNFQIIMTDVNSFTNNIKPSKNRKKKLSRSNTTISESSKTIQKKTSLKRTQSQPHKKLDNSIASIHHLHQQQELDPLDPFDQGFQRQRFVQLPQGTAENVFENGGNALALKDDQRSKFM